MTAVMTDLNGKVSIIRNDGTQVVVAQLGNNETLMIDFDGDVSILRNDDGTQVVVANLDDEEREFVYCSYCRQPADPYKRETLCECCGAPLERENS